MKARAFLRKVVLVLCLVGCMLVGVPLVHAATPEKFKLSINEGSPGTGVRVEEVDPCPLGTVYVEAFYVDASGYESPHQVASVEGSSDWAPFDITLRHRSVTTLEPMVTYSQETPPGVAEFHVECLKNESGAFVKYNYQPQLFTVTGATSRLLMSPAKVVRGSMLSITPSAPCPGSSDSIRGAVGNGKYSFPLDSVSVDPTTKKWMLQTVIPEQITVMTSKIDLPFGKYWVQIWCEPQPRTYYADEVIEIVPPPINYVALGDSMSSGEGTFDYEDTHNNCHRSKLGYPNYVDTKLNLGTMLHAACGGAVTDDFYVANPKNANEPAQLSRLTADTKVVTLTIGGNDADFSYVLDKCISGVRPNKPPVSSGCSDDRKLQRYVDTRFDALAGKEGDAGAKRPIHPLIKLFADIHAKAPSAKIYVGGYAQLFGDNKRFYTKSKKSPNQSICQVYNLIFSVEFKDAQWVNKQAKRLNSIIQSQVSKAQEQGVPIEYVAPLFTSHRLCDSAEPWINELMLAEDNALMPESFHPKSVGYNLGYAIEFSAAIREE